MAYQAHPAIRALASLNHTLSEDFLGGPRPFRLSTVINLQKAGTVVFIPLLMWWFDHWSTAAWIYLALHGSYGICWLLKHLAFRDPNWEKPVTIGGAVMVWAVVLGPYWVAPFLLISGVVSEPPVWRMAVAVFVYAIGVVMMMVSDAQKFFTLRARRGLITDGMFKHVRHPNYLGEMLLYGAFALLVGHWLPWAILAWVWIGLFHTNMRMKEASMSRYPEWPAYYARTGMLLPRLFPAAAAAPSLEERPADPAG